MITEKTLCVVDHKEVKEYLLKNEYIEVRAMNYGCAITGIFTKDKDGIVENVICSFKDKRDFIKDRDLYLNMIVGPNAGRIAYGKYPYGKLSTSPLHNLHSGTDSAAFQYFDGKIEEDKLVFTLEMNHQKDGFPGTFFYTVTYQLKDNALRIEMDCVSDHDNLINMTSHGYFNLSGNLKRDIKDHYLHIPSHHVAEIHPDGHPFRISPIEENTVLDFSKGKKVWEHYQEDLPELEYTTGIDHPFVLEGGPITLYDEVSGRRMQITSDRDCLVVYACNYFDETSLFENDVRGRKHLCVALETQNVPNGINIDEVENKAYYKAGEHYHQWTEYKFDVK